MATSNLAARAWVLGPPADSLLLVGQLPAYPRAGERAVVSGDGTALESAAMTVCLHGGASRSVVHRVLVVNLAPQPRACRPFDLVLVVLAAVATADRPCERMARRALWSSSTRLREAAASGGGRRHSCLDAESALTSASPTTLVVTVPTSARRRAVSSSCTPQFRSGSTWSRSVRAFRGARSTTPPFTLGLLVRGHRAEHIVVSPAGSSALPRASVRPGQHREEERAGGAGGGRTRSSRIRACNPRSVRSAA